VAWAAAPPVVEVKGSRTTLAAVAGAGLMVLGIIGGLIGLLVAVLGGSIVSQFNLDDYGDFGGLNDPAAILSGAIVFFGVLLVVFSLVYLIAGLGVVRSRGWGRVMGLIVGILGSLFWVASLTGSGSAGADAASGGVFALVLLGIHLYITLALAFVWRRKAA
jgi:hypothetical protein